ncbi:armadillo-type protein [Mycena sanguinolenta]|nr:armadillo-type protein [Mycena sanguinolenta]
MNISPLPHDSHTPPLRMANPHEFECRSIHSWWSDSNSLGATIPLHTFAKPLAKFLHHRQVTALLAKNRDSPLSAELLDLLTVYLESKEISVATKTRILRELEIRAATEDDANIIHKNNGLPTLILLLSSSDPNILGIVCNIFATLAVWTYLDTEGLSSYLFERMVYLLMHENPSVRRHSLNALDRLITLSEEAAQAITNAGILNIATPLLLHKDPNTLKQTCNILSNLSRYDSCKVTLAGAVQSQLLIALVDLGAQFQNSVMAFLLSISAGSLSSAQAFHRLVALLRHSEPDVATQAAYALSQICCVDAGMYSFSNALLDLLGSADDMLVASNCRLLGRLAQSEVLNTAIARSSCCQYLVSFIGTRTSILQNELLFTLSEISSHLPGARAVANAMNEALSSPRFLAPTVLADHCRTLGYVASSSYEVANSVDFMPLLLLLWGEDLVVRGQCIELFRCILEGLSLRNFIQNDLQR